MPSHGEAVPHAASILKEARIRALVESGGCRPWGQLAQQFVLQDKSQLLFYERRIKDMPVRVLVPVGLFSALRSLVYFAGRHRLGGAICGCPRLGVNILLEARYFAVRNCKCIYKVALV